MTCIVTIAGAPMQNTHPQGALEKLYKIQGWHRTYEGYHRLKRSSNKPYDHNKWGKK
jgi:hypothetical protein